MKEDQSDVRQIVSTSAENDCRAPNKDEEQITLESSFRDDLGADSLDLVEMIMGMEEMFDIEIDEGEAESIKTVGDAIRFIKKHIE